MSLQASGNRIESIEPDYQFNGKLKVPKRFAFANHMTRVVKLDEFSSNENEVFLKMDDETGCVLSGNKIRKLEYIFQEISEKSKGCEIHIITFGASQSNHCRATVALARRCGFIPHVFLAEPQENEKTVEYSDGNLFLMEMMGANIQRVKKGDQEKSKLDSLVKEYVDELMKVEKRSVHVIPVGASIAMGCFGYIEVMHEIVTQFGGKDKIPEFIFVSTGSVGTICGLVLGVQLFELNTKLIAVSVSGTKEIVIEKYKKILNEFNQKFGTSIEYPDTSVFEILDGYVGKGYGIAYKEEIETIQKLAQSHGIIVDPVYTGKGFHGMIKEIEKESKKYGKVLFLHTGGIFGLLCNRQLQTYHKFVGKK